MEQSPLIGKRLGVYEVQSVIGSGGMATVYKGLDHMLQRAVAIKVLSENAAAQLGLVERFRQEARLLAKMQHPNIVNVYTFGKQDGLVYIVQQLLSGPTLGRQMRERIDRGERFSREEVITVARQIASALDAAHAAGIIHRDIKPDNAIWNGPETLMLTDFGIARTIQADTRYTQTGMIVGTPDYLSPEQAQGQDLTAASDVYSMGVLLYELLTGAVPFSGTTPMQVAIAHIQSPPPELAQQRPDLPAAVNDVMLRALAKDPTQRFGSAGELAQALDTAWSSAPAAQAAPAADIHQQPTRVWTQAQQQPPPAPSRRSAPAPTPQAPPRERPAPARGEQKKSSPALLIGGALVALLLLGALAMAFLGGEDDDTATTPTATAEPTDAVLPTDIPTEAPLPTELPPTELPPTVPPPTAPPVPSLPGTLAFASDRNGSFDLYAASGGQLNPLLSSEPENYSPAWSPDGNRVAFHSSRDGDFDIYVMNANGTGLRNLTDNTINDQHPAWSPDGRSIVYASEPDQNWDIYTIGVDGGEPSQLTNDFAGDFEPAWSPDGSTIAFTSNRDGNDQIYLIGVDGSNERKIAENGVAGKMPAWSPNGSRIAFMSNRDGNDEVYVMNADGSNQTNLTNHPGQDTQPAWSPNGQLLAFVTDRDNNLEVYVMGADGSDPRNISNNPVADDLDPAW